MTPLLRDSVHFIRRTVVLGFLATGACSSGADGRDAKADSVAAALTADSVRTAAAADTLRRLEQEWADAIRARDTTALDRLVAAEFQLTGGDTTVPAVPREVWMMNTLQNLVVDTIRLSPAAVVFRGDTADVSLQFFWTGRFRDLPPFRDSTALTDSWVRGPSGWQVVRRSMEH